MLLSLLCRIGNQDTENDLSRVTKSIIHSLICSRNCFTKRCGKNKCIVSLRRDLRVREGVGCEGGSRARLPVERDRLGSS